MRPLTRTPLAWKSALCIAAASAFLAFAATASARADREHIIVSGGVSLFKWEQYKTQPHDRWWLNFIRAARLRIEQIQREYGPDAQITWLVYSPAYKTRQREEPVPMLDIINSVRDAYGVRLIYFDRGSDVISYLNSGKPRGQVKIQTFDYFGHSNKACFMFDYSNEIDSASKQWLHEDELGRIQRGIFAPNAEVTSWGCHTGESFSQKWLAATGVPMRGAIGKTQYMTHELPILSTPGGRWTQ